MAADWWSFGVLMVSLRHYTVCDCIEFVCVYVVRDVDGKPAIPRRKSKGHDEQNFKVSFRVFGVLLVELLFFRVYCGRIVVF